jgi:RimJ/RimL family protein N-acetyltransferase
MAHNAQSWEGLRLDTDRLRLRTPTPRDADALYDLFKDPDVMHGLGKEPVSGREQARAIVEEGIAAWRTDALGPFTIETAAANREVVGQAGLMIFDTRGWTPSTWGDAGSHAQPELGWALIRAHWGHGYATEAVAAIREWAQEFRSIELLVSLIAPDNLRSQRVAERLGAVPTETVIPVDSGRKAVVWEHPLPA